MSNAHRAFFFVLLVAGSVFAKPGSEDAQWSKMMERGELRTLMHLKETGKLTPVWEKLMLAVSMNDAEVAAPLYRDVVALDHNGYAGKFAARRLEQYYSISGITPVPIQPVAPKQDSVVTTPVVTKSESKQPEKKPVASVPKPVVATPPVVPTPAVSVPPVVAKTVEKEKAPAEEAKTVPSGKFAAQFGVFSTQARAEKVKQQLVSAGLEAEVVQSTYAGKTVWRVWSGRFQTQKEAAAKVAAVRSKSGVDGIVTTVMP